MYEAYEDQQPPSATGSIMNQNLHLMPSTSTLSQDRITQETSSSKAYRRASRISEKESLEAEIKRTVRDLRERLDEEKRRADRAERKVEEVTSHLKAVNEARLVALREASQAKEELRLYRMQLDTAQREIYRAQDVISLVDKQRHNAEKEAAHSRSKARQLNETLMVHLAREQAWREGLQEGLDRGMDLAEANALYGEDDDDYTTHRSRSSSPRQSNYPTYDEPARPASRAAPSARSRAPSNHRAPSVHTTAPMPNDPPRQSTYSNAAPTQPVAGPSGSTYAPTDYAKSVKAPSVRSHRTQNSAFIPPLTSSAGPGAGRPESIKQPSVRHASGGPPSRPPSINPSESIRPVSVRSITPTTLVHSDLVVPPDNLIPTLDADLRIRLPPPHEFKHPVSRSASPNPGGPSPEPIPIPAPRSQSDTSQGRSRQRRLSSSTSSTAPNPYYGQLSTPMSAIQEVNSQYTGSPNVGAGQTPGVQHQRSVSDMSHRHYAPSVHSIRDPQLDRGAGSAYAGSLYAPPTEPGRKSVSSSSSAIGITVQPPSQPSVSNTTSHRGHSPAPSSHRTPSVHGAQQYQPHDYGGSSHAMPGGYEMAEPLPPTVTPSHPQPYYAPSSAASQTEYGIGKRGSRYSMASQANSQYGNGLDKGKGVASRRSVRYDDDDVEVRSRMSADSLTTPLTYTYEIEQNPNMDAYMRMAGAIPIQPGGVSEVPPWVGKDGT